MKYLHTMVRVRDLGASLRFYCEGLGLLETRRMENAHGRYTLVFLAADETPGADHYFLSADPVRARSTMAMVTAEIRRRLAPEGAAGP